MKFLILFLFSLLVASCQKAESEHVETSDIYASMRVRKTDAQTAECYTRLSLQDTFGNSIELSSGETLICNGVLMSRETSALGQFVYYKAQVPLVDNRIYRITFSRTGGKEYISWARLPEPIQVFMPKQDFKIKANESLDIDWLVDGTASELVARLANTDKEGREIGSLWVDGKSSPEKGILVLPSFKEKQLPLPKLPASLTLTVTRYGESELSPSLYGHISSIEEVKIQGTLVE